MSYVRCSFDSDVYIIGTRDGRLECCGCPQHPSRCTSFVVETPDEMIKHLDYHREEGFKVPERAYRRLRAESVMYKLTKSGWVRKRSKWQLPRQLSLVQYAPGDFHYVHDRFMAIRQAWVPAWCARVARLPQCIEERRHILYTLATHPQKRAAIEAAFDTTRNVHDAVLITIAEAEIA